MSAAPSLADVSTGASTGASADGLQRLALESAIALAGSAEAGRLAVLLGWPTHQAQAVLAGLAPQPAAAAESAAASLAVSAATPDLSPLAAWYRAEPAAAASAVERALALHLNQGRVERAAPIALGFGSAAQRLAMLTQAGWSLLWRPERPLLGELLDSVAMEPEAEHGTVLALRLAWWIEVERVPHVADRRLQQGADIPPAYAAMFRARIAQIFDDARGALALAREAMAGHPNDLQAPALLARYALGFALLDAGHPQQALPPLADVVRGSVRDGLPMLALDAMAVQARAFDELGDAAGLEATLAAARRLAQPLPALRAWPALQSLERLRRQLALRRPFITAANGPAQASGPAQADGPAHADGAATSEGLTLADAAAPEAYEAFPNLVIDALAALQAGDLERAGAQLAVLEQRLALAFHCAKWRNSHLHARLWWLACRPEAAVLGALLAPPPPLREDATLVELHHMLLQAAAALLAGQPWPAATLQALQAQFQARGLMALQRRLLLLQAIGPPGDGAAMLSWLSLAADGQVQDALWLAPKLAVVLQALLSSVAVVRHPAERALAQQLFQHMQAAPAGPALQGNSTSPVDAAEAATPSPPPADLTLREWEILRLIGQHYTNEQIAARLNVSIATVKTHINRVYGKLGIGSRAEAVQRARHLA